MIISAVSLWKKFDTSDPLEATELMAETIENKEFSHVSFSGHAVEDGRVRIYARFCRPKGEAKRPAILLLPDAAQKPDEELMGYFVDKGYAVLMPDYSGRREGDEEETLTTSYPPSLEYGNYEKARGLLDMTDLDAEQTTWFEWVYVALYCIEYLKSREDVNGIGIVGIRTGGDLAWQTMLSSDVKCGVPINAVGWRSFLDISKFGENNKQGLTDNQHRYIAAVEAQSYAPYVKCPVLMLCGLRDQRMDCDRAYDTYSRIGNENDNALLYSLDSGACIGPNALMDMDLFLERYLKGREIYIPDTMNVTLTEVAEGLEIFVESDKEGILEELTVVYAEADDETKSVYRDWHTIYKTDGKSIKDGRLKLVVKPFEGAQMVYAYACAKYINGFRIVSKITGKRLSHANPAAVKMRMLFSGKETDCFTVAEYGDYSIGDIFLDHEAMPKLVEGYGNIKGVYSVGGLKTYKMSSPKYVPDENAILEFDVYMEQTDELKVSLEVDDVGYGVERYSCEFTVKGGGKWKRIILKAGDMKGELYHKPLSGFHKGKALLFTCKNEENVYAITNILWL